jgi:divalent metal cation (Fe/Co/Zn/Cd) transporter
MSQDDAHAIATSIEDTIREEMEIEATIHVDPLEES